MSHQTVSILFLLAATAFGLDDQPSWRYVVPPPGDAHEYPPLRAIALATERPEDLKESAEYRGTQRYAQIRFGSTGSVRVTVVLDQRENGEADLYVDSNRNRTIEPKERVSYSPLPSGGEGQGVRGQAQSWRLPLDVAIVEGDKTRFERRSVIFRLGATGRTLSFAAAGYLEGTVTIGEREVAVRRQDGDGNGFFTDAQDRLWFDLDGDGRWDAANEQFLFSPILAVADTRFVVRSDVAGSRLAMEKLVGAGKVRVELARRNARTSEPGKPALPARRDSEATAPVAQGARGETNSADQVGQSLKVLEFNATLVGRDGSAVGLRGAEAEAVVPVGEYRISTLTLSVADPGSPGAPGWNFVFSDNGGRPPQKWYNVEKDATLALDPIGKLEMLTGLADGVTSCRPGESLNVQPRLFTGDGLLINMCFRGTQQTAGSSGTSARIALLASDGTLLGQTQSGFA